MSTKEYHKSWFQKKYYGDTEWRERRKEYNRNHPIKYKRKLEPLPVRFWKRVLMGKEDECWPWKGFRYASGYGRFSKDYAHRLAYELSVGLIPNGLCVCHSCDNPSCVNPLHLWVGTVKDNMRDRDSKKRDRHSRLLLRL